MSRKIVDAGSLKKGSYVIIENEAYRVVEIAAAFGALQLTFFVNLGKDEYSVSREA